MNILLFEDSGLVSYYMKDALRKLGHAVQSASTIAEGDLLLRRADEGEAIEAIIADINMPTEGLPDDEKRDSQNGLFTGWFWLRSVIKSRSFPVWRCIIYTDYRDELLKSSHNADLAGIRIIAKKGADSSAEAVLRVLDDIQTRAEREQR